MPLALLGCASSPAPGHSPKRASASPTAARAPRDCTVYDTDPDYLRQPELERRRERLECELSSELIAFVGERTVCSIDADCSAVYTWCPFGCGFAVAREHAEAVRAKYEELTDKYERLTGVTCKYKCNLVTAARCDAGRCVDADLPPRPQP